MYPEYLSSNNRKQQSLFIKLLFPRKKMNTLTTTWWANFYYIYFVHLRLHTQNFKERRTVQNVQVQLACCNLLVKLLQHPVLLFSNLKTNHWEWEFRKNYLPIHNNYFQPPSSNISIQLPCYQDKYDEDASMNHPKWYHVISLLISTLPVYHYSMKAKKPQESDQHGFVQTNPPTEQTCTAITQDYPPHLI